MARSAPSWSALQGAIAGEVVLAGGPGYEAVRRPAIARFHELRPAAVVLCRTPEDVAETIAFAVRYGLPTATRSGGHCFAGRSSTDGVVIDVRPMRSVAVSDGVARIGAGARLGEVYDALIEHGVTIPAGCGPAVGIAGLTLGGGLGILGRRHGLTSDSLLGAQVVLADGRVVECDEHHDADLFWALRGAGAGGFGVVTSLVLRTLPPPAATSFHMIWPRSEAVAVIDAWQEWAPAAPDEIAVSLLITLPADLDRPPLVNVFGAMLGTEADTAELLDGLVTRAGSAPASASRRHLAFRETKRFLAEHGPGQDRPNGHAYSRSEFFRRSLPIEAIAALVDGFLGERVAGESRELDFTPWGGAYNRVPADATAFVHRNERFLLKQAVVVEPDAPAAERRAARGWLDRSWSTAHPWGSGGVYPNFPEPGLADPDATYHGQNAERLRRVRRAYDPDGFFRSP